MKRIFILLVFLVTFFFSFSQHIVRFFISAPPGHSLADTMFIAGSFNGWNPADKNYRFEQDRSARLNDSPDSDRVGQGNYFFETRLADATHEFKITRGSWARVECSKSGADIQNRLLKLSSDTTIHLVVEEWADHFTRKARHSTASKNVHIIDTAFRIPQLNRVRRIWIYFPPDYNVSDSDRRTSYRMDKMYLMIPPPFRRVGRR